MGGMGGLLSRALMMMRAMLPDSPQPRRTFSSACADMASKSQTHVDEVRSDSETRHTIAASSASVTAHAKVHLLHMQDCITPRINLDTCTALQACLLRIPSLRQPAIRGNSCHLQPFCHLAVFTELHCAAATANAPLLTDLLHTLASMNKIRTALSIRCNGFSVLDVALLAPLAVSAGSSDKKRWNTQCALAVRTLLTRAGNLCFQGTYTSSLPTVSPSGVRETMSCMGVGTAFHAAVLGGCCESLRLLLSFLRQHGHTVVGTDRPIVPGVTESGLEIASQSTYTDSNEGNAHRMLGSRNSWGMTPAEIACLLTSSDPDAEMLGTLISYGAEVGLVAATTAPTKDSCLMLACQSGNMRAVQCLLTIPAGPRADRHKPLMAFHPSTQLDYHCAPYHRNVDGWSALCYAVRYGHVEIVALLLPITNCLAVETLSDGDTLFHLAAVCGCIAILAMLVERETTEWDKYVRDISGGYAMQSRTVRQKLMTVKNGRGKRPLDVWTEAAPGDKEFGQVLSGALSIYSSTRPDGNGDGEVEAAMGDELDVCESYCISDDEYKLALLPVPKTLGYYSTTRHVDEG